MHGQTLHQNYMSWFFLCNGPYILCQNSVSWWCNMSRTDFGS